MTPTITLLLLLAVNVDAASFQDNGHALDLAQLLRASSKQRDQKQHSMAQTTFAGRCCANSTYATLSVGFDDFF